MREIKKYRYFFAAILTLVVFLLGIFMSNYIDGQRYSALENEINQNNLELESRQLQLSYLRSDRVQECSALKAGLQDIVSSYNRRLGNLQSYESDTLFREDEFHDLKRSYILSGVRYWMFAEEINDKCGHQADTVLYFTTGIGAAEECEECGKMGEQLSLLKKQYGEGLLIFTIPTNMEDGMIDVLEGQYNVTDVPTVVVNSNSSQKIEGFKSREKVEEYFELEK